MEKKKPLPTFEMTRKPGAVIVEESTALADRELTTPESRKADIEKAIAKIFEGGIVPDSVIVMADLGPDSKKVRVSVVGSVANLVPLAVVGNQQLQALLTEAYRQTMGDKREMNG